MLYASLKSTQKSTRTVEIISIRRHLDSALVYCWDRSVSPFCHIVPFERGRGQFSSKMRELLIRSFAVFLFVKFVMLHVLTKCLPQAYMAPAQFIVRCVHSLRERIIEDRHLATCQIPHHPTRYMCSLSLIHCFD